MAKATKGKRKTLGEALGGKPAHVIEPNPGRRRDLPPTSSPSESGSSESDQSSSPTIFSALDELIARLPKITRRECQSALQAQRKMLGAAVAAAECDAIRHEKFGRAAEAALSRQIAALHDKFFVVAGCLLQAVAVEGRSIEEIAAAVLRVTHAEKVEEIMRRIDELRDGDTQGAGGPLEAFDELRNEVADLLSFEERRPNGATNAFVLPAGVNFALHVQPIKPE